MLSTPASIETQPASPSRSIISSLQRSMRVWMPNLMRRARDGLQHVAIRQEDLVDEVDVLDAGGDQAIEFFAR